MNLPTAKRKSRVVRAWTKWAIIRSGNIYSIHWDKFLAELRAIYGDEIIEVEIHPVRKSR